MAALFLSLIGALRSAFHTRADLALENLALRQQLANVRPTSGRPRLRKSDRAFWLVLSRLWSRWADVLVVVKPDTVVRWHRAGFRFPLDEAAPARMPIASPRLACSGASTTSTSPSAQAQPPDGARMTGWRRTRVGC